MILRRILFVWPLVLMACVPEPRPQPSINPLPAVDHRPDRSSCGADAMQNLVGQSSEKLQLIRFAGPVRIILPGQMVAMDYQGDRVTIQVGPEGLITRVTCG